MTKTQVLVIVGCATLASVTTVAFAKRLPPKPVAPVVANGIRYAVGGDGRDQYVVATDNSSGKELWKAKVFHTEIKPWMEEDVQEVFITDLKLMGNALFVRDEKARCYSVDLKHHGVNHAPCSTAFP